MAPPFDKLLVLDLDETLVYACESRLDLPLDGQVGPYFLYLRPGARAFLDWARVAFSEVAVWTASTQSYAIPLVEQLLGGCEGLAFVWCRKRCTRIYDPETRERSWIKDLKKLRRRGYARERILVVDNTPSKWERSYGNLIAVCDFEGDPNDRELVYLRQYLTAIGGRPNPRSIEKRAWRHQILSTP